MQLMSRLLTVHYHIISSLFWGVFSWWISIPIQANQIQQVIGQIQWHGCACEKFNSQVSGGCFGKHFCSDTEVYSKGSHKTWAFPSVLELYQHELKLCIVGDPVLRDPPTCLHQLIIHVHRRLDLSQPDALHKSCLGHLLYLQLHSLWH